MSSEIATPSGPSIGTEINAASRSLHTNLNRLITTRLPLCLPPHASSPQVYASGLAHFAPIYLTFESLFGGAGWLQNNDKAASTGLLRDSWVQLPHGYQEAKEQEHQEQILEFICFLLPKGIHRSKRLLGDLALLTNQTRQDVEKSLVRPSGQEAEKFVSHMKAVVTEKPHVLVAYAWCFYMAIFSGGRWMRGQFLAAGEDFWHAPPVSGTEKQPPLSEAGLSFFHFDGNQDGEDIKTLFKANLEAADAILTPEERSDIAAEAKEIFDRCQRMVVELDQLMQTPDNITRTKKVSFAPNSFSNQSRATARSQQSTWLSQSCFATFAVVATGLSWYAFSQS